MHPLFATHPFDPRDPEDQPDFQPPDSMKTGIELIAEERATHTTREGYTAAHDAEHKGGEIAMAAVCFAAPRQIYTMHETPRGIVMHDPFPWGKVARNGRAADDPDGWYTFTTAERKQGKSRLRQLQIAGALIAAEMDRLLAAGETL